jgi:hypothetical protein
MLAVTATLIGAAALAQEPIELPPLPVMPADAAAPIEPLAPQAQVAERPPPGVRGSCTPGHCTHRLAISRRRCKRHLQEVFIGYPEEFERPPLGAMMHAANAVAVGNAEAASMILRPFDFHQGTARLNLRGGDKLRKIGRRLPTSFAPVIVERSRNAALDQSRRSAVLAALGDGPFPVPPERVVIAPSISQGVSGEEGLIIHGTELNRTEMAGPRIGLGVTPSLPASSR